MAKGKVLADEIKDVGVGAGRVFWFWILGLAHHL
jgi:hypothetical protein